VTKASEILDRVCAALDRLVAAAGHHHGLFPSLLDRRSGEMLRQLPEPIEGQRNGDRAPLGSNLIHDEAALKTMYALSGALGRPGYAEAADACLSRFAKHCTATATGLFPWGEHSFWNLAEDRAGNSYREAAGRDAWTTHDHLRQAPLWLWEKLAGFNPGCVERFAEGLDFHWTEGGREEYIRHARIEEREYPGRGERSCDFPRHGGFYVFDWSFAWKLTGREEFLAQIRDMLDYWWTRRRESGLLLIESRSPEDDLRFRDAEAPGQTVSLAASLLESAELLSEPLPDLAARMRERAAVYVDGFFSAPHDLAAGVFLIIHRPADVPGESQAMPVWGSRYGVWPASYVALTCLCAHRLSGDARLLEWAEAVGRACLAEPFPEGVAVPAMDAGLGLGLLADLYDITGESEWFDGGLELAGVLADVYMDAPLPRGAAGIDWYESQMGPGFLLHGLARTALLADSREACPLAADYTAR
jgi:hypothetical protein